MRFSTPLAAVLTFATAILITTHDPAGQPPISSTGAVIQQSTAAGAAEGLGGSLFAPAAPDGKSRSMTSPRVGGGGYAYFPPNRPGRIAATWDRDVSVIFRIAKRDARPSMFAIIKEAFRRARVQTRIQFRYGGRTASSEPGGTPDQPVVLVDFGTSRNHPRLAKYRGEGVYAVGGPLLIMHGATGTFTGGQVTIDVQTTRGLGGGFRHGQLGATMLHEIGHVLGLAHVNAPGQLMAPGRIRANISGWFHDGDLRGLRRLIHR